MSAAAAMLGGHMIFAPGESVVMVGWRLAGAGAVGLTNTMYSMQHHYVNVVSLLTKLAHLCAPERAR